MHAYANSPGYRLAVVAESGMLDHTYTVTDPEPTLSSSTPQRVQALRQFTSAMRGMTVVSELRWSSVEADPRLLVISHVPRRQLESLEATVTLIEADLGHLSVSFVRTALEERLWLGFLVSLDQQAAKDLFLTLGRFDALRALTAQRDYVGDDVMRSLWYPEGFVEAAHRQLGSTKEVLKGLRAKHGWQGLLPPASWIADQVDEKDLYEYLHSATSRAVHFSAGEVMRRGWGDPAGNVVTNKPEFRQHLADFALDQLWRLYLATIIAADPLLETAGLHFRDELEEPSLKSTVDALVRLGQVPLVHAAEWNLTPEGTLGRK